MSCKAIVNIFSSYNNILMTATDLTGAETITTCNGGEVVKAGKDKGGQFAATRAAERMADALKDKEFNELIVKYRAPGGNLSNNTGPGAQAAIRALTRAGMTITRIEDVTRSLTMERRRRAADVADVSDEEGEEMKTEIVAGWPQGHEIRILISETDASQVNAIRRALIADVPKLAITRVDFSQGVTQDNKGEVVESVNVLPDEVLAHRLAMIPIPTNLDEGLVFPDACQNCMDVVEKDKGCPMCQVLYTLSARGPASDADEEFKTVYAGDITTISDPVFDIRDEHKQIPLTVLAKGQFLEFYAFAVLGRGRDHAKWSPVAAVGFRPQHVAVLNKPKKASVLFDLGLTTTDGKAIDAKLFGKDKKVTDINHVMDLEKALHQVGPGTGREDEFDDAITLEPVEGAYVFSYETDGSLDPVTAFNMALDELKNRFTSLSEDLASALA